MEIVVRTDTGETVVKPEDGRPGATMGASAQGMGAGAATNAGSAPTGPGQDGAPPANVAATEPPRSTSDTDESAGAAPQLS